MWMSSGVCCMVVHVVCCLFHMSYFTGFLVTGLEAGTPYSQVVQQAFDLGYTEPDPRDDLGGVG